MLAGTDISGDAECSVSKLEARVMKERKWNWRGKN
jgi:hypothetical protein